MAGAAAAQPEVRLSVALIALLAAGPVLAAHDGTINVRTGPEPSDIALAIFAAGAVWFVRRALRNRFRGDSAD